jgi:hypothetical protein
MICFLENIMQQKFVDLPFDKIQNKNIKMCREEFLFIWIIQLPPI